LRGRAASGVVLVMGVIVGAASGFAKGELILVGKPPQLLIKNTHIITVTNFIKPCPAID